MYVKYVRKAIIKMVIYKNTYVYILEKNHSVVNIVQYHLEHHLRLYITDLFIFVLLSNIRLYLQLKTHIRCHSGAKPYKCLVCGRSFPHNNTLKIHLRRHYNDRQYNCEYCPKNFFDRTALVRHSRTHTGGYIVFLKHLV